MANKYHQIKKKLRHIISKPYLRSIGSIGIMILFIFMLLYIVERFPIKNPYLGYAQYKCDQDLIDISESDSQEKSYSIMEDCKSIINKFSNNPNNNFALYLAYKNLGRAKLVYSYASWQKNKGPKIITINNTQLTVDQLIEQVKENFKSAEKYNPEDPLIKLYIALMEDFKDFVLNPESLDCLPASQRYEEAINLYIDVKKVKTVDNNFFALLELGHFLVSRDRNKTSKNLKKDKWNNFNGYKKGIELYNKLQVSDQNGKHTVLLSKAKAQLLNKDYEKARDSFEKILQKEPDAYQIRYYIGNSYILENGQYDQAIKEYDKVTENPDTELYYYALRDSGFAYYMTSKYDQAKDRLDRALNLEVSKTQAEKERRELMEEYFKKIKDGQCDQLDPDNNSCELEDRKSLEYKLFDAGFFQSIFTVHDKKRGTDPFIDVEHDKFYQCRNDPEF
ncbi:MULTISPECIES: tetratricopeptide repeat protein [unclassified Moorena]|uniref:tetratricopeptide repeat protein n=1 Tax=unclassified Moorena TaxID=2683338 RepID=UPI0013B5EAEE|nr:MULTISPECIES: tetratricopeptide repeat protein [unclassified Moorena]NER91720.1 tetratricopeptide repeat protein [Moorena sp. SIO3A2]NES40352.1 tetratricopeptide repeat protein [Moorena sp. SIO2C4]